MSSPAARVLVFGVGIVVGLSVPTFAWAAPGDPTLPENSQASQHSDQHASSTTATTAATSSTTTPTTTAGQRGQLSDEGSRPPGNNGTVKVDRLPFDDHPDNEPHVGCTFQIDFYNYDQGDLQATVLFELHDPTDEGTLSVSGSPLTLDIGGDPNGGGTDLDASGTYTLSFTGAPHPQQGHHVKLTIDAEGSHGAQVKHKVFWVEGCGGVGGTTTSTSTSSTSTSSTSTSSTSTSSTSTSSTSTSSTATTLAGGGTSSTLGGFGLTAEEGVLGVAETAGAGETAVLGATVERSLPAQAGPAALARTGAGLAGLAALGAGLVVAGQAARRRAKA